MVDKKIRLDPQPDRCTICQLEISSPDPMTFCPNCNQHFHPNHLRSWLNHNETCPVCQSAYPNLVIKHFRQNNFRKLADMRRSTTFSTTASRAPSKSHVSYFDTQITPSRNACACDSWKFSLIDTIPLPSTRKIPKWVEILGYFILCTFLFTANLLPLLIEGTQPFLVALFWVLIIEIITLVLLYLVYQFIRVTYNRLNCPVHSIIPNQG